MSVITVLYTFVLGEVLIATVSSSLSFTIEPADHVVAIGSPLLLNCQAQYSGPEAVAISWKNNHDWLIHPTNKPWTQLTNNSLFYSSIPAGSIGTFLCSASVLGTSLVSNSRTANVQAAYITSQYSTHPANITKRLGETATFDCVNNESLPYASIHWEKDGKFFEKGESFQIPGTKSTSSAISLRNLMFSNAGWYGCVAINPMLPNRPQRSIRGYLTVLPALDKPHFGIHPTNKIVPEHLPVMLQCQILGVPPPVISWTFNGQPLQNKFDRYILSNGSLYFAAPVNRSYAGNYACNGRNSAGSVSSGAVLFIVAYFDFAFIENPKDHTAVVGETVTLRCVPPISFPVQVSIRWYHDYQQITPSSGISIDSSGTIEFTSIKKSDEGTYFCDGINSVGVTRTSSKAFVTVHVPPSFQVRPQEINVTAGNPLSLHCQATGSPHPNMTWQKDGQPVNTSHVTLLSNGSLYIASTVVQDAGRYSCRAINVAGSDTVMAKIIIYVPPSLIVPPANATKVVGETVRFRCLFDGIPQPDISWVYSLGISTVQLNQTGENLEIEQILKKDEGKYVCQAVNFAGQTKAEAYLTVKVPASIDFHPVNVTVNESSSASFQCNASGDPKPGVAWFKQGTQLSTSGRVVIAGNSLTILNTVASDAGQYSCNVSNGLDSHVGVAHLIVQVTPNITLFDVPPFVHWNATLKCEASGIPQPRVTWYRNGGVLSRVRRVTSRTFVISNVSETDAGLYTCVASNAAGISSRHGNLTVQVVPSSPIPVSAVPQSSAVIELSWKPGFDGHSPITEYKLERARESGPFFMLKNVNATSYIVDDLDPYTTYTFRISALNAIGEGPGANFTNTTLQDAPSPPENVTAVTYNSTAIRLSWDAPASPNGQITWYEIQYNVAGSDGVVNRVLSANQLLELGALIGSLMPFTRYELRIRAATTEGNILWGNFSVTAKATTGEAAPVSAPQDVKLEVLAAPKHSVLVKWKPVPPELANGEVKQYVVFRKATGPYRFSDAKSISAGTALNFTLRGLFPWTKYNVSVLAVTTQPGPMSPWKQIRTSEDAPGPPSNVTLKSESSQSILVTIVPPPPAERNGVILGYTVLYSQTNSLPDNEGFLSVNTSNSTLRLTNLTVFTEYTVKVAAYTSAGLGKESPQKTIFTQEGVPGTVDDVTATVLDHDTILVRWSDPVKLNGKIVQYSVTYNTSNGSSSSMLVPADTRNVTIDNLTPNTTYFIFVTAKTSKGFGKRGTIVSASTSIRPPPITQTTETNTTPPIEESTNSSLGIPAGTGKRTGVDKEQMIIIVVCVGLIVLFIIGAAVYFLGIKRWREEKAVPYIRHRKKHNIRNPAFGMERPRLDVTEEPSVAETNYSSDSFDSDFDTSVASPNSIESHGNVTHVNAAPKAQFTTPRQPDRSPMVKVRSKNIVDSDYEDPSYSSVEELGGGFSSFGPLPPVEFRSTLVEEREDGTSPPSSRMSFTNELFEAVHSPEDADLGLGGTSYYGFQEKDISGMENRGYDLEDAKKPVASTAPPNIEEMYAKVDKAKMKKYRRKEGGSSGSESPQSTTRAPRKLSDVQATRDPQLHQVSGRAEEPAHDPVVVYDERTNLDVEDGPTEHARAPLVKQDALSVGESTLSSQTNVSDLDNSEATDPVPIEDLVKLNHEQPQAPREQSPPPSPYVLRNRKLSVGSEDSFYDEPYNNLEEIDAGVTPVAPLSTPSQQTLESAVDGADADDNLKMQDSIPTAASTMSLPTKPYGVMDEDEDEAVVMEVKDIETENTLQDLNQVIDGLLDDEPPMGSDQTPSGFFRSDGVDSTVLMF